MFMVVALVALESLWCHFGHFGMTFRSLWVYDGYFGVIFVDLQKYSFSKQILMILYNYLDNLGSTRSHFGVALEHFGIMLESLWAYRRRMARVMPIVSLCVRPKWVHKQEIHIFPMNFEGSRWPRADSENERPSEPTLFSGHFGVILCCSGIDVEWHV